DASCAIDLDGQARCWGFNLNGQLANGDNQPGLRPQPIPGLPAVKGAWPMHTTCALEPNGAVWCLGDNSYGGAGRGEASPTPATPNKVEGIDDAVAVAAGLGFACALREDATVSCWGANLHGTIGDGTQEDRYLPVRAHVADAVAIASHAYATCA